MTLTIEDVPLDDPATYRLIAAGETDGVFQLESSGMKQLCRQLAPSEFNDLVAILALYRPGPMSAGMHVKYAERKHGREPVTVPHPDLAEILRPTYGILVYQEQVLEIARLVAGYTLAEADLFRRAIGKKKPEEMEAQHERFLAGTVANGYAEGLGGTLWDLIEGFADYAFNKSHSAGYALVSYWTAYLKAHHPAEYMAALLSSVRDDRDRLALYLHAARQMGLDVLQPDVNASGQQFAPTSEGIRFGLSAVKGVGVKTVEHIIAARPYTSFHDFASRVDPKALNKGVVSSLVQAGAFESLGHTRAGLASVAEHLVDCILWERRSETPSLFAEDPIDLPTETAAEWPRRELLAHERSVLGLYVSDHPLRGVEDALTEVADYTILEALEREGTVTVAGVLASVDLKISKRGQPYATAVLDDMGGSVELLMFESILLESAELLDGDAVLLVRGRLEVDEAAKLIATSIRAVDFVDAPVERPVRTVGRFTVAIG